MTDNTIAQLTQFHKINQKLKKRLFKKANAREATEQFRTLLQSMLRDGNVQYAAFCHMALARCEQSLANPTQSALAFVNAGNIFWQQELSAHRFAFDEFREYSSEGIQCYLEAIQVYKSQQCFALAGHLYFEMAEALKFLGHREEALEYFTQGADIVKTVCPMTSCLYFQEALTIRVLLGDHAGAVLVLQHIIELAQQLIKEKRMTTNTAEASTVDDPTRQHYTVGDGLWFAPSVLCESYITLLFLLLIQRETVSAGHAMQDFQESPAGHVFWETTGHDARPKPSMLSVQLKSILTLFQRGDRLGVEQIYEEMSCVLSPLAGQLLATIAQSMHTPWPNLSRHGVVMSGS